MAKSTTTVTKEDVEHVAELLMLKLTEEEIKVIIPNLQTVLENVEVLDTVDTSKAKETHHVTGLTNVLRKDEVKPSLTQEEALANAAKTEDGYIKVKGKLSGEEA
jgi:aspartyl-tRNA(Asn)/glutamyl-tRNA(Gln) amidotransferase subunit C